MTTHHSGDDKDDDEGEGGDEDDEDDVVGREQGVGVHLPHLNMFYVSLLQTFSLRGVCLWAWLWLQKHYKTIFRQKTDVLATFTLIVFIIIVIIIILILIIICILIMHLVDCFSFYCWGSSHQRSWK